MAGSVEQFSLSPMTVSVLAAVIRNDCGLPSQIRPPSRPYMLKVSRDVLDEAFSPSHAPTIRPCCDMLVSNAASESRTAGS